MKRLLSNLLVAATIALGAAAARAEEAPTTIRFGDVGFGFGAPFGVGLQAIADAKGFIADEFKGTPTKVEFTYFTGTGPAINEALSNNQLDFASYGAVPNIIGKANGLDTVILASYGGTTIFGAARPDLDIKSIADLKGKKVAIQKATIIHWGLITALKNAGLSEKTSRSSISRMPISLLRSRLRAWTLSLAPTSCCLLRTRASPRSSTSLRTPELPAMASARFL